MTQLATAWSTTATQPSVIVERHMVQPGETAQFRKPGISVVNLGTREAGIFLRAGGTLVADVPIALAAMPSDAAAWIAEHVLTRTYLTSCGGLKLVRMCACQYGRCGHCGQGNHHRCTTPGRVRRPATRPRAHPRRGPQRRSTDRGVDHRHPVPVDLPLS
ncbi:DUF6248 family natural product biosynthesis protein [Krasilnikovia sp. MM14-A1004]|uniref:DUF6248 family natural product biosynthesis protein n=1 Tax=Krasilnikovia sp. MM14-A1004 TaxID=3373541 RepID=UPI00399CC9F4